MRKYDFLQGEVLLIDKPKEWTSFDVIRKLQGVTKYRKFGHAGTLDPLATGLLIICSGKKTKEISKYQDSEKEYEVEFLLGGETKTYDSEFKPENFTDPSLVTIELIKEIINSNLLGNIEQKPPIFSAIKINGVRSYKRARKGDEIELPPRKVEIKKFQTLDKKSIVRVVFENGKTEKLIMIKAIIVCSKGTYIRSLVHDLGQLLGVGGYIRDLRRTRIGDYSVESAITIENLVNTIENQFTTDQ